MGVEFHQSLLESRVHDQNPPEWAGERTGFGLNAVVHPFGVVHDCKLGGVSESSEMSKWARVVGEENEKGNVRNDLHELEPDRAIRGGL
jgi:hypothetical protein